MNGQVQVSLGHGRQAPASCPLPLEQAACTVSSQETNSMDSHPKPSTDGKSGLWLSTVMKFLVEFTCGTTGVLGCVYLAQYPDGFSRV